MVRRKHLDSLIRTFNRTINRVRSWITGIGLKLAVHKTGVVPICSSKRMEFITTTIGNQRITSKQVIKYVGVVTDNRLMFRKHLTYIGGKSEAISCTLARIISNLRGPKQKRKRYLLKIVTSIEIYAALIYVGAMDERTYRTRIDAEITRDQLSA